MMNDIFEGLVPIASVLLLISAALVDSDHPAVFLVICMICGLYLAGYSYFTEGDLWN